jgi:hypothetical protein
VELNGDGHLDLLSGSYSRQDQDMAGLFQVCWGDKDGKFGAPEGLKGDDGNLLIITTAGGDEAVIEKICTRPTACDLDGDGKLDIVSGNFGGTFAFFRGEGGGKFAAKSTWLQAGGEQMKVQHHSDPFLVDWDKDGDLDLLSGSASGGVFLFVNEGSKTAPKFAASVTLVPTHEEHEGVRFGDAHLQGPQGSTRVWADDVDGDGKLDLLVGDGARLVHAQKGVDEAEAKKQLEAYTTKIQAVYKQMGEAKEDQMEKLQKEIDALDAEKEKFVREEATGFVWLLRQK